MKRALTAFCLLLILTAVSTGPGIAWADSHAQVLHFEEGQPGPGTPQAPGEETELLGDPDDAITGNRGHGVLDDDPMVSPNHGAVGAPDEDVDSWLQLWLMLLDLGLV